MGQGIGSRINDLAASHGLKSIVKINFVPGTGKTRISCRARFDIALTAGGLHRRDDFEVTITNFRPGQVPEDISTFFAKAIGGFIYDQDLPFLQKIARIPLVGWPLLLWREVSTSSFAFRYGDRYAAILQDAVVDHW